MSFDLPNIDPSEIAGFSVIRTVGHNDKFCVFAVSRTGERLVAIAADVSMEEAMNLASTLNSPYEKDPELTELIEVQEGKSTRMYYAVR